MIKIKDLALSILTGLIAFYIIELQNFNKLVSFQINYAFCTLNILTISIGWIILSFQALEIFKYNQEISEIKTLLQIRQLTNWQIFTVNLQIGFKYFLFALIPNLIISFSDISFQTYFFLLINSFFIFTLMLISIKLNRFQSIIIFLTLFSLRFIFYFFI